MTLACVLLAACGDGGETAEPDAGLPRSATLGTDERPAQIVLPPDPASPVPLVVLLHGYSVSARLEDAYLRTTARSRTMGFALLLPDGTIDGSGNRFWNALPGFNGIESTVDDVGYLLGLIDEALAALPIDPERVYLFGHSNGGFMAYRLACEHADRFAALATLAGSSSDDPAWCTPSRGVSVLQIHGDADDTILYEGGVGYASAYDITAQWAGFGGCAATPVAGTPVDFEAAIDGAETEVQRWDGCDSGIAAELWSIRGGGHIPAVSDEGIDAALAWLLAR